MLELHSLEAMTSTPRPPTCSACQRPDLVESDFSVLSLHILRLNPQSQTQLLCSQCMAARRESQKSGAAVQTICQPPAKQDVRQAPSETVALAMSGTHDISDDAAFKLGQAILSTATIAPREMGSDEDLEEDLVGASCDDAHVLALEEADSTGTPQTPQSIGAGHAAPLTSAVLAKHEQRTESVERRQFNCPQHGTFWRKVTAHKPVARCDECGDDGPKYEAIAKEEERGRGLFRCGDCGNQWTSNSACRGLAQYCQGVGCFAMDRQKGTFPHQMRAQLPRSKMRERRATAAAAGATYLDDIPEDDVPRRVSSSHPEATACNSYAGAAACSSDGEGRVGQEARGNRVAAHGAAVDTFSNDAGGRGMRAGCSASGTPNMSTAGGGGGGGSRSSLSGGVGTGQVPRAGAALPLNADGEPLRASAITVVDRNGHGTERGIGKGGAGKGGDGKGGVGKGGGTGGGGRGSGGRGGGGRGGGSSRDHFCSGCASGACRRPPPISKVHIPTGSTATFSLSTRTWSTNGSVAFTEGSINSFFLPLAQRVT